MNETNPSIPQIPSSLSESGEQRREAMLHELLGDMRRMHGRRRAARKTMAIAALPIAIAAILMLHRLSNHDETRRIPKLAENPPRIAEHAPVMIVMRVHTDPAILDRWRASTTSSAVWLNDDMLLAMLEEFDRPAGLIRVEGHAWLTDIVVD